MLNSLSPCWSILSSWAFLAFTSLYFTCRINKWEGLFVEYSAFPTWEAKGSTKCYMCGFTRWKLHDMESTITYCYTFNHSLCNLCRDVGFDWSIQKLRWVVKVTWMCDPRLPSSTLYCNETIIYTVTSNPPCTCITLHLKQAPPSLLGITSTCRMHSHQVQWRDKERPLCVMGDPPHSTARDWK